METEIVILACVRDFLDTLDRNVREDIYISLRLLQKYGYRLSMPDAKPVGKRLWELRPDTSITIRILYGFCRGEIVLLLGFKKQQSAIRQHDFHLAQKRLKQYCK
jgi:phage-related protein